MVVILTRFSDSVCENPHHWFRLSDINWEMEFHWKISQKKRPIFLKAYINNDFNLKWILESGLI